jgi:hypothetical protein
MSTMEDHKPAQLEVLFSPRNLLLAIQAQTMPITVPQKHLVAEPTVGIQKLSALQWCKTHMIRGGSRRRAFILKHCFGTISTIQG